MKKTGENIKQIREEQRISVSEVQRFLEISSPQACQRDIGLPSVDRLCALSHLFDMPMNDILVLETTTNRGPSVLRRASQKIPFVAQTMLLLTAAQKANEAQFSATVLHLLLYYKEQLT